MKVYCTNETSHAPGRSDRTLLHALFHDLDTQLKTGPDILRPRKTMQNPSKSDQKDQIDAYFII